MNRNIKYRYLFVVILISVLFLYQKYVSEIGWKIALLFDYSAIDKDGIFMPVSVHHIVMALISFGILYVLQKKLNLDFKLKLKFDKAGIHYTAVYSAVILIYYVFWFIVFGFVFDAIAEYSYELNTANILGTVSFQLLLSGIAEELMFRALPIGCLQAACRNNSKFVDGMILMITSLLFTIAHVNFTIPFSGQWYSLIYVFVNGMVYGVVYLKSNSIFYPMIMHGISNFISVGGCYLYMVLHDAM